jgi:dTMP kinase
MGGASHKGRFIVLEGIDGAGTTTQTSHLVGRLKREGHFAKGTREPSDGPVGTMIRQVLGGRYVLPSGRAPGWATMALLFAADRLDHVEAEIEPVLERGGIIVSDRYDASSLAYQSVTSGRGGADAVEWIRALNRHAVRPDVIVVVDVAADLAATRREARGEAAQLYEQNEVQRSLSDFYRALGAHMPDDRVVVVDGVGTVEEVHDRIYAAILATCGLPQS